MASAQACCLVTVPYYEGYNRFALWPAPNSEKSSYGLFEKDTTTNPACLSGNVVLPYFRSCLYVAYKALDSAPGGVLSVYHARPEFLCYHNLSYHITDIQLCPCQQLSFGFINNKLNGVMSKTEKGCVGSDGLRKGQTHGNYVEANDEQAMTERTTTSLQTFTDSLLYTGDLGLGDQVKAIHFLEKRLEEARKTLADSKAENDGEPSEKRQRLDPDNESYEKNENVLPEQFGSNLTAETEKTEQLAKIKAEEVTEGSRGTSDELGVLNRDLVALKNVETKETEAEQSMTATTLKDAECGSSRSFGSFSDSFVRPEGGKGKTHGNSVEPDEEKVQTDANCVKPEGGKGKTNGISIEPDDEQVQTDANCAKPEGGRGKTHENSADPDDKQVKTNANCVKPEGGKGKAHGNSVEPDDEQVKTDADFVKPEGGKGKTHGNSVEPDYEQVKTDANFVKPEGGKGKTHGKSVEPDDEQVKTDANFVKPEGGKGKTHRNSVEPDNEHVKTDANCVKPEGGKDKTHGKSVEPDDKQEKTDANCVAVRHLLDKEKTLMISRAISSANKHGIKLRHGSANPGI